jgi:uncharacterized protein
MALDVYDHFVTFSARLRNLDAILKKAEADAEERKIDPQVFLHGRLAPDMFPFVRQVQIMSDQVKGGTSRLAGQEPPKWADDEQTFADLRTRIAKSIDHVETFRAEDFAGWETRDVELKFPNGTLSFKGRDYLLSFVIPNFYFHYTTAYLILRHNGVRIGKRDYTSG